VIDGHIHQVQHLRREPLQQADRRLRHDRYLEGGHPHRRANGHDRQRRCRPDADRRQQRLYDRRLDITFNSTRTTDTITATAVDVVWTASGGNLGSSTTGRYVSIYDDTSTSDNLLCSYDYGATFTVATGETFTLDFGASLFTLA
jgi:hypothetical protein